MLARYNPRDLERILSAAKPPPPFPPASDRAAWNEIRRAIGEAEASQLIARAEDNARCPIPALPATLYLELKRTGQREGYQEPLWRRRAMLATLTLAECLEGSGRFLDPILDVAWAICEESSWAYPAHQFDLADVRRPYLDLNVASTALELAELDLLLGAQLDPALGKRIRDEVDHRCFTPYLTRHDFWWLYATEDHAVNNWTAVCNAGIVGAALYLEQDAARLAEIVARGARSLDDYLATFDPDGGSSEGPGYWSYGFGNYTILAHLVEHRTGGAVSFLDEEGIVQIAQFPLRTLLSPGSSVNFSDCDRRVTFVRPQLVYLSRRLDLPDLMRLARAQPSTYQEHSLSWRLRGLCWRPTPEPADAVSLGLHDWFSGMMWMIARQNPGDPNALVLAAKGGHNGEMHNQNDVGTIIVHLNGESVIADLGRGRYTRAYFGPERYDHLVNSSLGHSVPVVNGRAQLPGENHAARLLDYRAGDAADLLSLDLKGAYPDTADLDSLQRVVTLHREPEPGRVELVDTVRFAQRPGLMESVLTTFGSVEIVSDAVIVQGERGRVRIRFDPDQVQPRLDEVKSLDLAEGPTDVRRICFAFPQPVAGGAIRLVLEPDSSTD